MEQTIAFLTHLTFILIALVSRIIVEQLKNLNCFWCESLFLNYVFRLAQYASRTSWYLIQQRRLNPHTVDRFKSLEYTFSTFRKLLRLGRCLDVIYSSLKTIHYEDLTLRVTCTLSKISNALFLLADHILWIGRSGLYSVNINKWSELSNKYWLYSIIMNLMRDFYEILKIIDHEKLKIKLTNDTLKSAKKFYTANVLPITSTFIYYHKDVMWDTIKNGCDIWIPLTALGYTNLKPGTIGVLGMISSVAGIISLIDPLAKLLPS